jgi:hypothetical protein
MRFGHELLKMQAALRTEFHLFEEEIEQQGFAASDAAEKIEPDGRLPALTRKRAEHPPEPFHR